jgi:hypothetical protein
MLNRTNRTLSANTHRLNLGTRSFAQALGLNIGSKTLRLRHAHPQARMDAVRTGVDVDVDVPIIRDYPQPSIPGSPSRTSLFTKSCEERAGVTVVAEESPSPTPVVRCDRGFGVGRPRGSARPKGLKSSWSMSTFSSAWPLVEEGSLARMTPAPAAVAFRGAATGG